MDVFGTVSFPSDAFKLVLILCIANQVVEQTQVLDVGQCKSFVSYACKGCMLKLNCVVYLRLKYMNMRSEYLLSGMTPWQQDILKILQWDILKK